MVTDASACALMQVPRRRAQGCHRFHGQRPIAENRWRRFLRFTGCAAPRAGGRPVLLKSARSCRQGCNGFRSAPDRRKPLVPLSVGSELWRRSFRRRSRNALRPFLPRSAKLPLELSGVTLPFDPRDEGAEPRSGLGRHFSRAAETGARLTDAHRAAVRSAVPAIPTWNGAIV